MLCGAADHIRGERTSVRCTSAMLREQVALESNADKVAHSSAKHFIDGQPRHSWSSKRASSSKVTW